MSRPTPRPWPVSLTVPASREACRVAYEDGTVHELAAEYLRVETPSAERKGHGHRIVLGGKRAVRIRAIEPVGRYAVRIVFSDGHDSGLYTFDTLHALGAEESARWHTYLEELDAVGLDRERPGSAPAPPRS